MTKKSQKLTSLLLLFTMTACILPSRNLSGSVQAKESIQPAQNRQTADGAKSISISKDKVTYETTADYVHTIYANGMPLILVASETAGYAKIYMDENQNGTADTGEELTTLQGDGTLGGSGIYYDADKGYFLTNSTLFGGAKEGSQEMSTSITMTGATDNGGPTLWLLYGGNDAGTLTGNTHIRIDGGNMRYVFAGNRFGEINGNTQVEVTGGTMGNYALYGGNYTGTVHGNTNIRISGGTVHNIYGGNEVSGVVEGNTSLVFEDGALITGWVYGGGAGYDDHAVTEVAGSTNIVVNGGEFRHNIYGGGAWRGASVKDSNITINGGDISNSTVFGGGEEQSIVSGRASVTVNSGSIFKVCASGAGFNDTAAVVGSASIVLKGGAIEYFYGVSEESTNNAVTGDLDVTIEGEQMKQTTAFFGYPQHDNHPLQNVDITIRDGELSFLMIGDSIAGTLSLTFDHAWARNSHIAEGTLAKTADSRLTLQNCGADGNKWGAYNILENQIGLYGAENPVLSYAFFNRNRFRTIVLKDSYVNYVDASLWDEDRGLKTVTDKLTVDGGALRVVGSQQSHMPDTVFLNHPLLIRSSEKEAIGFEGVSIEGQARLMWLSEDGETIPEHPNTGIVETENEVADRTFVSGREGYGLRTDSVWHSANQWRGKAWYMDQAENLCTCTLGSSTLKQTIVAFPAGEAAASFLLEDAVACDPDYTNTCNMLEHRETVPTVEYRLISDKTTTGQAHIEGDRLHVDGLGTVSVQVVRRLNGKEHTYTADVLIIRMPQEQHFTAIRGAEEDLTFAFEGVDVSALRVFDKSGEPRKEITNQCTETDSGGIYQFTLPASYLKNLEVCEHLFWTELWMKNGRTAVYEFTVTVMPPKEVTNPAVEIPGVFHYDGTAKEPQVIVRDGDTVIPSNEYAVSYENNVQAGTAKVMITDRDGGRFVVNGSGTFSIINEFEPQNGREYTATAKNEQGWLNKDFTVTAMDGYLLSRGNTLQDEWVSSLTRSEETSQGTLTFYVKDLENGRISLAAEETYKIDRTKPDTFAAAFNGNPVLQEIGMATFEHMFNHPVEVSLSAADSLSGIHEIAYFCSDSVLTEAQLAQVQEWTPLASGGFSVEPEDGRQFVIYGRATDQAGNTAYFGTDGAEFDLTAPVFAGAQQNQTYYTTQKMTVSDRNLVRVTLNGENVSNRLLVKNTAIAKVSKKPLPIRYTSFVLNGTDSSKELILPGNTEQTYVVWAIDKAGNESSITITMKSIASLAQEIADLTENTVTSSNQETINNVMQILPDENTTEEEKQALQQVQTQAQKLQKQIDEAGAAIRSEMVEETMNISAENVQMADKEKLEQAKSSLEMALKKYSGNYTKAEHSAIQEEIVRIKAALTSIEKVQDVTDAIQALPDAGLVKPDDTAAETRIRQAKTAYDTLSAHEQSMLELASVEKLNKLLQALVNYLIVEGNHGIWEQGYIQGLTFLANGAFSKFTGVKIDGTLLDTTDYEAKAYLAENNTKIRPGDGSTIVILQPEYLQRLSAGTHNIIILYTDGEAAAEFTIAGKSETPKPENSETPESSQKPESSSKPGTDTPRPEGSDRPGVEEPKPSKPAASEPGTSKAPEEPKPEHSTNPTEADTLNKPGSAIQSDPADSTDNAVRNRSHIPSAKNEKHPSPKTDDKKQPWIWLTSMFISISLFPICIKRKKKKL